MQTRVLESDRLWALVTLNTALQVLELDFVVNAKFCNLNPSNKIIIIKI